MNAAIQPNFRYLNAEGHWQGFELSGLSIDAHGSLRLRSLPLLETDLPAELAALDPPSGTAGIAWGPDHSLYFTQPDHFRREEQLKRRERHWILRHDGCQPGEPAVPLPCVGGYGNQPTQFNTPRGLLYHPLRRALFVADSENHQIQIFDIGTFQLLDIWGRNGSAPGDFARPQSLASDSRGNVYVVDHGNKRVQKFDLRGAVLPQFWDTVQNSAFPPNLSLEQPSDVAAAVTPGNEVRIYVLDSSTRAVFVFNEDGQLENAFGDTRLEDAKGIAADATAIYVGANPANGSGRVFQFTLDGEFVGAAVGYQGPVAALGLDATDGLWVHSGANLAPIRLAARKGSARSGYFFGGPFKSTSSLPQEWHRFEATVNPGEDSHIQFFVFASTDNTPPPLPPSGPRWAGRSAPLEAGFVARQWLAVPPDVDAAMIPATLPNQLSGQNPTRLKYIWMGAEFGSEGRSSPELAQIRLEFDHEPLLKYLPAVYEENDRSRLFLGRFLSLFESFFDDLKRETAGLPRLFDATAAPPAWLPWLAGWLAFDVYEQWPKPQKRRAIAEAFDNYARRGTPEGLRQTLRLFAGIEARVEEPLLSAAWWSLPENNSTSALETAHSVLGFTTMLAPAEAQGAVVGTTAILDQSHLTTVDDFGASLFQDVAYQFNLLVYRGQVSTAEKLAEIQALVDREKPAHTACHICVVEPRLRVGFQARLGIDTVIAGPAEASKLGDTHGASPGLILGGAAAGRVGDHNRIGMTTRLDHGAVEGPVLGLRAQ